MTEVRPPSFLFDRVFSACDRDGRCSTNSRNHDRARLNYCVQSHTCLIDEGEDVRSSVVVSPIAIALPYVIVDDA